MDGTSLQAKLYRSRITGLGEQLNEATSPKLKSLNKQLTKLNSAVKKIEKQIETETHKAKVKSGKFEKGDVVRIKMFEKGSSNEFGIVAARSKKYPKYYYVTNINQPFSGTLSLSSPENPFAPDQLTLSN